MVARAIAGLIMLEVSRLLSGAPLGFMGGRIGVLQTEAFVVIGLSLFGLLAAVRSVIAPKLGRITTAAAATIAAVLATSYHLLLINGLDEYVRSQELNTLVEIVKLPTSAKDEICSISSLNCGSGYDTGNPSFDKDLRDWTQAARDSNQTTALLGGSLGTPAASETYVWAAKLNDAEINWVRKSYAAQTAALEAVFFALASAATAFLILGGLLVEALHRRAWRRRAKNSAQ